MELSDQPELDPDPRAVVEERGARGQQRGGPALHELRRHSHRLRQGGCQ